MPKLLPALAAGVAAVTIAFTPALAASAAPAHHAAKASKHYTLSVTGNGKHASVVYLNLKLKDLDGSSLPSVHTIAKAKEPWTKKVASGADLYELAAVQTTGSKLHCTIKNTHGKVVAESTSYGKGSIVTCIVAKGDLLTGAGGLAGIGGGAGSGTGTGTGSSTGSGTSTGTYGGSLVLPIR